MSIEVQRFENRPISSSCYLIRDLKSRRIIVVDPGTLDMSEFINNEEGKFIDYIILTHEHFDHIWGCNDLYNRFKTRILCSTECSLYIKDKKKNLSVFYNQKGFTVDNPCKTIGSYNTPFIWREHEINFLKTEGHSDSSISFVLDKYLFTGDTLIENLKTVTKLKNGSKEDLFKSIAIYESFKGQNLIVCPGHGDMFDLDNYDLNKAIK